MSVEYSQGEFISLIFMVTLENQLRYRDWNHVVIPENTI